MSIPLEATCSFLSRKWIILCGYFSLLGIKVFTWLSFSVLQSGLEGMGKHLSPELVSEWPCLVLWLMPAIPAPQRLEQEDRHEFGASLIKWNQTKWNALSNRALPCWRTVPPPMWRRFWSVFLKSINIQKQKRMDPCLSKVMPWYPGPFLCSMWLPSSSHPISFILALTEGSGAKWYFTQEQFKARDAVAG